MTETHETTVSRLLAHGYTLEEAYAKSGQPQPEPEETSSMAHLVGNRAKRLAQRSQERRDKKRAKRRRT